MELAEEGIHAVSWARAGDGGIAVALAPGDSATPWSVTFTYGAWDEAAFFTVDVGAGFMSAPGMTPDAKPGYVMWDTAESRVAIVYRDPDRSVVDSETDGEFDGFLPEGATRFYANDVADLAQLIAELAIGWRDF
jgi:hypothetical protein